MYDPANITLPANFMAEQPVDSGVLEIRDEKLAAYPRIPDDMRRHLAEYYACITSLDFHLGRIIDSLEKSGRLSNTLVVFSSDQGLAVGGRHGLMGKQNLYEHFKSPLIVAGPGVPHGESDALVYLFDLFPTLCDLAGIAMLGSCDGASLGPILRGEKHAVRDALFEGYMDSQRMVRDDQWKLIWRPKSGRFQLFDLQSDPHELTDLANNPEHQSVLMQMRQKMAEQQARFGDDRSPLCR